MKKIITSCIILIISILIYETSYAADAGVEFNFTGDSKITQGATTVSYTISLGSFTEISENAMMGYEAVLEYDSNVFSSASIEGLNEWTAQYTESTKRLIGETRTKAEANKAIAKITLTLKEDAPVGETTVKLNEVLLTVNDSQDFNYSKEATLTIEAKAEEPKNDNENQDENKNIIAGNEVVNQVTEEDKNQINNLANNVQTGNNITETNNTSKKATENNSKVATVLPKTGIGKIAMFIMIVAIVGIGCLIRYKSIQTK